MYAFEPMLNTAGCVSRTRFLNDLPQSTVVPIALGNKADLEVETLLSVRGMIDSTLQETEGFRESFLISRLDWLWPKISPPNPRIDGVKIDVQGMEIDVLEGMVEVARKYRPKLLVELHAGVSRQKFLEVIASMGYLPHGVPIEPLPGETEPVYADSTYLFQPEVQA